MRHQKLVTQCPLRCYMNFLLNFWFSPPLFLEGVLCALSGENLPLLLHRQSQGEGAAFFQLAADSQRTSMGFDDFFRDI
jgi:hypothetical protein